jgi:hypothetical protein
VNLITVLEPLVVTTVLYPVMVVPAVTVCEGVIVQDDPLPAVIVVPEVTPVPDKTMPMAIVPDVTDATVSVVVAIEPTKTAVVPVVVPL